MRVVDKKTHLHSTPITTLAYTELFASLESGCEGIFLFDSSGKTLALAKGAAGSEVEFMHIPPGGLDGVTEVQLSPGTRLSVIAKDADTAVGSLVINIFA
jgi:hypothetical protein